MRQNERETKDRLIKGDKSLIDGNSRELHLKRDREGEVFSRSDGSVN